MKKTTSMADAKIKTLLKKMQSIVEDEDNISSLEKDLVKGYLRDLYELVNAIPTTGQVQVNTRVIEKEISKPVTQAIKPTPPPPAPSREEKVASVAEVKDHTLVAPPPVRQEAPVLRHLETVSEERPNGRHENLTFKHQPQAETEETPMAVQSIRQEIPEVIRQQEPLPTKYAILFESGATRELSDMLSRSPISDIQKAFSINDRLLIVADLFEGQQEKFKECVDILNAKYSFDEAKSYMTRYLIEQYNWLEEERSERARDFIRVVERRYLNK